MVDIKPYYHQNKGKKAEVAEMFDNIAARYDFLNHFLSFGIDKIWRRKAIRFIRMSKPRRILDVATGTGDFAIAALKSGAEQVVGVDISEEMLAVGRTKLNRRKLNDKISLEKGDSEQLHFSDASFDAVTVAFGVRNFEDLQKGLSELRRVVKPGGVVCILEFSKPSKFPVKQLYNFYSFTILPLLGRLVSKDPRAYTYLPESIAKFPEGESFLQQLSAVGFSSSKQFRQTFGVATIYLAYR